MTLTNIIFPHTRNYWTFILHGKFIWNNKAGTFPEVAIYTVWLLFHVSSRFLEVKYSKFGSLYCEGAGIT